MLKLVVDIKRVHLYIHVLHAHITDLLREGDELLEVNGIPVIGKSTDEIVTLMVCARL